MTKIRQSHMACLVLLTLLLSGTLLILNTLVFQYHIDYRMMMDETQSVICFSIIYGAIVLKYGQQHLITLYSKEVLYYFLILYLMLLSSFAVQATPFDTIDDHLRALDELSHTSLKTLLVYTNTQGSLMIKQVLALAYGTLTYEIFFIPLILICIRRFDEVHEFYFLLLLTMLIGFTFYYFFPTMAPASVIDSPYFIEEQRATGLKFRQLHQHLLQTTVEGGLIALPSFHAIWAYLCLYLVRGWPIVCWLLLPLNCTIALSCILLGWHYPIDLLGSAIVIVLAHVVLSKSRARHSTYVADPSLHSG